MERKFAEKIVESLVAQNGPTLSLYEALSMSRIITDRYEVYAMQKGDVTFLAWISGEYVYTKVVCW